MVIEEIVKTRYNSWLLIRMRQQLFEQVGYFECSCWNFIFYNFVDTYLHFYW